MAVRRLAQKFEASDARRQKLERNPKATTDLQRNLAISLELAYLHLADHPDIAREVRMTAHHARSQHRMTSNLMIKFSCTADFIIDTMIPIIVEAIESKSPEIIKKAFAKISERAEKMKNEAEATASSCQKLQTELLSNQDAIGKKNSYIKGLKSDIKKELQMEKDAQRRLRELENKQKELDENLQSLTKHPCLKDSEYYGLPEDADETFLDNIRPGGRRNVLFKKFIFLLRRFFITKEKKTRLEEDYQDVKNNFQETMTKQQTVKSHMKETEEETHQLQAKMKALRVKQEGFGNVESIIEASKYLGEMDPLLSVIISMWDEFAIKIDGLNKSFETGDVFVEKIGDENYAKRLMESILRAEKDWQLFAEVCNGYVKDNEEQIDILYGFLSTPIDSMSDSERSDRKKKLLSSLNSDPVSVGEITYDSNVW